MGWSGTKTSRGFVPVSKIDGDTVLVSVNFIAAESGSPAEVGKITVTIEYAVLEVNEEFPTLPVEIFHADNDFADAVISQTSAAVTAHPGPLVLAILAHVRATGAGCR